MDAGGQSQVSSRLRVSGLSENKYNLSVVCYSLLNYEYASVKDAPKRIAVASYLLRSCLKWENDISLVAPESGVSDFLSQSSEIFRNHDPGRILKHIDKRTLMSPHFRAHLTLEAIDIVASGFYDLGYLPGGSWMFRKGLDYTRKLGCEHFPSDIYMRRFTSRLAAIHHQSPTAIPDPIHSFSPELSNAENAPPLSNQQKPLSLSVSPSNQLHLNRVLATLEYQDMLSGSGSKSHIGRLCDLLDSPMRSDQDLLSERMNRMKTIRETVVVFETDSAGHLWMSVREGCFEVFHEVINASGGFQARVLEMYAKLDTVLGKNKELISTSLGASDYTAPLFWEDRRRIDEELGGLIFELEGIIFASQGLEFLKNLASTTIYMCVSDLLLGLPIEAFSCFQGKNIVRVIPGLRPPDQPTGSAKFYVVNPGGDCAKTEAAIVPLLGSAGWTGHHGTPTLSDKQLLGHLRECEIFLFSGHGGGEKHWSGSSIQRIVSSTHRTAPRLVLLMGCSSAKPYGDYLAPFCTPFHYLLGGCQIVVGTLWDVLGRELDRVTVGLLDAGDVAQMPVSELLACMQKAKQKARLRHLTSASFVVYMAV